MDKESSLLAYLVPRLTSRGEDTATDALAFILNKSEAYRRALESLLSDQDFVIGPLTRFQTQVTYEDGSRPDMVGYDREDTVRLVVESKFWAALLEGQASGYLRQLEESGPGILLFIAPGTRIKTLWAEIMRQLEADPEPVCLESVEAGDRLRRAIVGGSEKRVSLVSWHLVLDRLAAAVPADSQVASDLGQLRGFVEEQDLDAFQPIQREELSPSLARRVRWINHLIDDVVAHGVEKDWMSVKGLKATAQRGGYGRYLRFVDEPSKAAFFLCVELDYWAECGDTPVWLWVLITDDRVHLRSRLHDGNGWFRDGNYLYTPIRLKTGVEYHRVLDDVLDQLRRIAEIVVA